MKLFILVPLLVYLISTPSSCQDATAAAKNNTDGGTVDGGEASTGNETIKPVDDLVTKAPEVVTEAVDTSFINQSSIADAKQCLPGMLGKECRYMCMCENLNCNDEGDCINSQCIIGRYGDKCLDMNLAPLLTEAPSPLTDGDNSVGVVDGQDTKTLEVTMKRPVPFTFIRFLTTSDESGQQFVVNLLITVFGYTSPPTRYKPTESNVQDSTVKVTKELITSTEAVTNGSGPGSSNKNNSDVSGGDAGAGNSSEITTLPTAKKRRQADVNNSSVADAASGNGSSANGTEPEVPLIIPDPIFDKSEDGSASVAVPATVDGQCIAGEYEKPEQIMLNQNMLFRSGFFDFKFNSAASIKRITIAGEGLRHVTEMFINGGKDFAPDGDFFLESGYSQERPVQLLKRVYGSSGKICYGRPSFSKIRFYTNTTFKLNHVIIDLDWIHADPNLKAEVGLENEEGTLYWTGPACYGQSVIIGEAQDILVTKALLFNAFGQLPPICSIAIFGSCQNGFYGPKCALKCREGCSEQGCDHTSGYCESCKAGFYGTLCDTPCPDGCKEGSTCQRDTGYCVDGCKSGKYPSGACDQKCSDGCGNDGSCDETTGECKYGCKPSFFKKSCDENCKGCAGDGACEQDTGKCTSGCQVGFFGEKCQQKCSAECQNTCDMNTGICNSCPPGKTGDLCSEACTNCAGDGSCSQKDRACVSGCKAGYKGTNCIESEAADKSTMIIVIVVVGCALLVLIIAAGVCSMKSKPKKGGKKPTSVTPPQTQAMMERHYTAFVPTVDEWGTLV